MSIATAVATAHLALILSCLSLLCLGAPQVSAALALHRTNLGGRVINVEIAQMSRSKQGGGAPEKRKRSELAKKPGPPPAKKPKAAEKPKKAAPKKPNAPKQPAAAKPAAAKGAAKPDGAAGAAKSTKAGNGGAAGAGSEGDEKKKKTARGTKRGGGAASRQRRDEMRKLKRAQAEAAG